jgi:hypothetical protein
MSGAAYPLVLLAEQVLDGDLDVIVGDVGSAGRGRVGSLYLLRLDALAPFDEQDAEPLVRLDTRDEIVAEDTVLEPNKSGLPWTIYSKLRLVQGLL